MPCRKRAVIICAAGDHTSSVAAYEEHADCSPPKPSVPPHTNAVFVSSATAVCPLTARCIGVRVAHALDASNVYTVFTRPLLEDPPNTYGRVCRVIIGKLSMATGNG